MDTQHKQEMMAPIVRLMADPIKEAGRRLMDIGRKSGLRPDQIEDLIQDVLLAILARILHRSLWRNSCAAAEPLVVLGVVTITIPPRSQPPL